ncbi:hypothetical protein [Desulfurispira natronophila]|uniref:DNA-binding response OmpR family regulator n=1 Tax=Desulfurispira natronophila TaxID=682562 RepID=A0A7W7Y4H7_9BACT|nr:hypothetical protein [Desulfurispira natronophila]MBB5021920.1 DNA-binding response OmpR family regulator [Desulfurispira natronophila]
MNPKTLEGQSILYIEADENTRMLVARMLSRRGAKVAAVATADVARKACNVKPPSAVILGEDIGTLDMADFLNEICQGCALGSTIVLYRSESAQLDNIEHHHVKRDDGFGKLVTVLEAG